MPYDGFEVYKEGSVIGLVMAAGYSWRFGSDKRCAKFNDSYTFLGATQHIAQQSFAETWIVLREEDDEKKSGINDGSYIIRTSSTEVGLGNSLATAFGQLMLSRSYTIAVMLGDMPWVTTSTCHRLAKFA